MKIRDAAPAVLQAGLALCLVGGGVVLALIALTSTLSTLAAKVDDLGNHRERVHILEARLATARQETKQILAAIGARPGDLETLSDPSRTKALLERVCEEALDIGDPANGAKSSPCVVSEMPLSNQAARYQARATIAGDLDALAARLPNAIRPPIHLVSLSIEDGSPNPAIALSLEVPGARAEAGESK